MVVHLEFTKILDDSYEIIDKGKKTESKIFNDKRYEDAYESYKDIYNGAMVRGKGNLDPKDLEGKPIQLDINNYTSLVSEEYFVSTKADGLRFLMMFSNGFDKPFIDRAPQGITQVGSEPNRRNIYFIDSQKGSLSFWYINRVETNHEVYDKNTGDIPGLLGIDKCLMDGELLFWGKVEKVFGEDGTVSKYIVSQDLATEPAIVFLAFDIMYGPTFPHFKSESHNIEKGSKMDNIYRAAAVKTIKPAHRNVLEFGSSGAMLGFKGAERWPTEDRRQVLETMFNNQYSNIISYLQEISPYNFTILVSPFVPMEIMLNYENPYEYMKKIYEEELKIQYQRNTGKNIQNSSIMAMFTDTSEFSEKNYRDFNAKRLLEGHGKMNFDEWVNFEKQSKSIGKGILDDGLIFTPKFKSYIIGPWTFCGNKQYKWKPAEELTIDFRVGELVSDEDNQYLYSAEIGRNSLFKYMERNSFIESSDPLQEGSIVETSVQEIKNKSIIFAFKQFRYDKRIPNAYRTAESVMNAYMLFINGIDILKMIKMMRENIEIDDEQAKTIVSLMDPTFLYKNCVLRFDKNQTFPDEVMKLIYDYAEKDFQEVGATALLSLKEKNEFTKMIDRVKKNENLELEGRITFRNEHRPYSQCLVSKTIGKKHETVPMIRAYGSKTSNGYQYRSTYISLGSTLMHESTMKKKDKSSFNINVQRMDVAGTKFLLYDEVENVKITLASEKDVNMTPKIPKVSKTKKVSKSKAKCECGSWGCDECMGNDQDIDEIFDDHDEIFESREKLVKKYLYAYGAKDPEKVLEKLEPELRSDKSLSEIISLNFSDITNTDFETDVFFNYQVRHVINSMSLFWKVEIIEYGSAKTWQEAEKKLDSGPSNEKYPDNHKFAGSYIKNAGARTRIEIEFAPAAFFDDYLKFYKENPNQKTFMDIVELLNLNPEDFKEKSIQEAYDEFEKIISFFKVKLRESDSKEILEDYMNVLVSVLNSFYA